VNGARATVVRVARSFWTLAAGEALNKGLRLGAFVYAANMLGVSGFGILSLSIVVATYAMSLTNPGLSEVAVRDIARNHAAISAIVNRVLSLRVILATLAYGVLFLASGLLGEFGPTRSAIRLYGLIVFPFAVTTEFVFRGLQEMHHIATIKVISGAAYVIALVWWIQGPDQVLDAVAGVLIAETLGIAYVVAAYVRRFGWPAPDLRRAELVALLKNGVPIGISLLPAAMPYSIETVLLSAIRGVEAVGLYNAAARLAYVLSLVSVILGSVLFPTFSMLYQESRKELAALVDATVRFLLILGPPLAALGMVLSAPLIVFLYGPVYSEAIPAMRLLFVGVAFTTINAVLLPCLLACDAKGAYLSLLLGAASLNVLLNVLTIPHFGVNGSAAAVATSEAVLLIAAGSMVGRLVPLATSRWVKGAVPAIGALSLCTTALRGVPVGGYLAGLVVYGAALMWLGVLPPRWRAAVTGPRSARDDA
jgi:O-antigen/teichoic acid export membrane protein